MRTKDHYYDRVNRVLDYIGEHLDGDLSLGRLSEVGCFSPFHFHRIFQGITGETLHDHVRRIRLERAAKLMKASPHKRITDVAVEAGFAGTAEFSRAFRTHFDMAPSSWDRRSPLEKSKICKAPEMLSFYPGEELESWAGAGDVKVQTARFGAFRYVYLRIFEPYGSTKLVDAYYALSTWLTERQTDTRGVVFIGMSLDDPAVTPSESCRYDLGVAFPRQPGSNDMLGAVVRERGGAAEALPLPEAPECSAKGFSIRDLEIGEVAAIHCEGDLGFVDRAWHYLYRVWLPESGFEPSDLPAMQAFVQLPEEIGWEKFNLQACLPVARF